MNNPISGMLTAILMILFLSSCLPQHSVILVTDPDGRIGKAEVITAGGKQLLEKPGDMTRVSGSPASPSSVMTAPPDYIAVTFAEAMAAQPLPPKKFILFFATGTTTMSTESHAAITAILTVCKKRGVTSIRISGHTDATGTDQFNEKLARERALLIRDLLLQNGINPDLITVSSHGKGNPLVPTPDGVAEPRNRRVEVIVQ
ncbi:MAG: OmpA family protein [Desulfuromonadaceae bacterium]|nr:OmpA family protein [Desulfuromonadaceae bacterium]MDD5107055.1 OmpA family protein [Desulfuromonadaceae bacterium]